jgi:tRNA (guanine37-N1)-methyltransferase
MADIKSILRNVLPSHLLNYLPRSFDVIGSRKKAIAIIKIPEELREYSSEIAEAISFVHKNVDSVLEKKSKRKGDFRIRNLEVIYGNQDTEVVHKELGCLFKLNPQLVYFSTRESTERERIIKTVYEGEDILVMFSGVGPYPIIIAKKVPDTNITAVELNPYAHDYCIENIHLNKVDGQVLPILGDVTNVCPNFEKQFDRTIMPLPRGAYCYLNLAIPTLKPGGVLHFYHWSPMDKLFQEAEELIEKEVKLLGKSKEIIGYETISQYSPGIYKIRIDTRIF